jgi:hypothetical protein
MNHTLGLVFYLDPELLENVYYFPDRLCGCRVLLFP